MLIKSLCPWTVLYRLAVHGEKTEEPSTPAACGEDGPPVPSSVYVLLTAHEWTGRHGWCCADSGTFLLTVVEAVSGLPAYKRGENPLLDQALEQCFFCLYAYPSTKTRAKHLADHGVNGVELTWERAVDLYNFVAPKELPEFDSYRVPSISADLEALFKRIITLAPPEYDPATYVGELEK
jgi:calcineurin-binding protein cabin-1